MTLESYWPTPENVKECIRTEAEELAEHTLLAVHEPMLLVRKETNGTETDSSEHDLLKQILNVDRPIPIIGRSGVGKSHLIRWLHAQLKLSERTRDWHIVRIPKNASLKHVLELMLRDLSGPSFDAARSKIHEVGERLQPRDVAEHLLVFMGQQLRTLHANAKTEGTTLRAQGKQPAPEQRLRLMEILAHADDKALPDLITDSFFRQHLLGEQHCIYQFAKRLTQGATDDELSRNDYQIHENDLDFAFNIHDLSINARQYVTNVQFNTNAAKRKEAANVLNMVLGEATRKVFQNFFRFNQGDFQELFKEIRRHLLSEKRTLVILVEDMAAISAVEDVLIDSLLEEDRPGGVVSLCPLRSAIAVTDGYVGYQNRQGTIQTRARGEWLIKEQVGDDQAMLSRMIDFCSRYLNAARFGSEQLMASWANRSGDNWPPVWKDIESDLKHLDAFDKSSTGVPLFPFNENAVRALAEKYCRRGGELCFNPRDFLNEVVLPVLRDNRGRYLEQGFPPVDFAGIRASGLLNQEILLLDVQEADRVATLSAIWGYGSRTWEDLQKTLSADIAMEFGLSDFATKLNSGRSKIRNRPTELPQKTNLKGSNPIQARTASEDEALESLLENWFQRKGEPLDQETAKVLRKGLLQMFEWSERHEWSGLEKCPSLTSGSRVNIYLPHAIGNLPEKKFGFCSDEDFSHQKKRGFYQGVARAVLRFARNESSWNYEHGYDDFLRYKEFEKYWVPSVMKLLRADARQHLEKRLGEHVQSAWAIGVFRPSYSLSDQINCLLMPADLVRKNSTPPIKATFDEQKRPFMELWDTQRESWYSLVASNDHAMEGDLVFSSMRLATKQPPDRKVESIRATMRRELSAELVAIQVLSGCTSSEQFCDWLKAMCAVLIKLQTSSYYPESENIPKFKRMKKLIDDVVANPHWEIVKLFREYAQETPANNDPHLINQIDEKKQKNPVINDLQLINQIDGKKLNNVIDVVTNWNQIFDKATAALTLHNKQSGGDQLAEAKKKVDDLLRDLNTKLIMLKECGDA